MTFHHVTFEMECEDNQMSISVITDAISKILELSVNQPLKTKEISGKLRNLLGQLNDEASHLQQMEVDERETVVRNTLESFGLRSCELLLTAAELYVEKLGLPVPTRSEKRRKTKLIQWFCRYWDKIYPMTDSIVIGP